MKTVYLVRHGESASNAGLASESPEANPLTPEEREILKNFQSAAAILVSKMTERTKTLEELFAEASHDRGALSSRCARLDGELAIERAASGKLRAAIVEVLAFIDDGSAVGYANFRAQVLPLIREACGHCAACHVTMPLIAPGIPSYCSMRCMDGATDP